MASEVGRKDDLVIGDDSGLVLRGGLGEEAGHSADGLDDDVGAEEGALFGECGVLRTEGVCDGEADARGGWWGRAGDGRGLSLAGSGSRGAAGRGGAWSR